MARASYAARAKLFESIDWSRMSRVARGLSPEPPNRKVSDEKAPKGMELVVNEAMFGKLHGLAPSRLGRQCVCAFASFRRQGVSNGG